jgi:hypothetical protein
MSEDKDKEQQKKPSKRDDCVEIKNINYKNILLTGNSINSSREYDNIENLDKFLSSENTNNKKDQWCKLDKTVKTQKLNDFVKKYSTDNKLTDEEESSLTTFFRQCLDKKRLQRVKDVVYDKSTGIIKEIPSLTYDKSSKHFTLKNLEKSSISTASTLKHLTPAKKMNLTIRNIIPK